MTMICPDCGAKNPDDYSFCQQCGAKLPQGVICPNCGQSNKPDFSFCQSCGAPLAAADVPASEKAEPAPEEQAAPRRASEVKEEKEDRRTPRPAPKEAPPAASQPAAPQVVIIREEEKKRRRLPGAIWALLGALLVVMMCCGLLWFDVADVPTGVVERLPPPLDDIARQVVEAIENRQIPIIGGPAAAQPPDNGGDEGEDICYQFLDAIKDTINANTLHVSSTVWLDDATLEVTLTNDHSFFPSTWEGFFSSDFWYIYLTPAHSNTGLWRLWCERVDSYTIKCTGLTDIVDPPEYDLDLSICLDSVAKIQLDLSEPPPEPPIPPSDPCEGANIGNAIRPGSITADFIWDDNNYGGTLTLTNDVPFPTTVYGVSLTKGDEWDATECWVSSSDPYKCEAWFGTTDTGWGVDLEGDYSLTIFTDDSNSCPLATIIVTIPDPPPIPPVPPPLCPYGETYHDGWTYNNGCCTNGCWCTIGNWTGCSNECPDCPP
jgi:hypothetical protein